MPCPPADSHAPPPELDVPAARHAARTYQREVRRGVAPSAAWAAAVQVFALHHPAWPWPMAEREAARTVGALLALEVAEGAGAPPQRRSPPLPLLHALAEPVVPYSRAAVVADGPSPFRRAWRVPVGHRPVPARLPLLRLPPVPPVAAAALASPPC